MVFSFQIMIETFSGKKGYLQYKGENDKSGFNHSGKSCKGFLDWRKVFLYATTKNPGVWVFCLEDCIF